MNRRSLPFVVVSCVFIVFLTCHTGFSSDTAYDWPRWRGPNGNGISMETDWNPATLFDGPETLWNVDVGVGYSNVAIKDNRLYIMGRKEGKNHVFCLNAAVEAPSGKVIWSYTHEEEIHPIADPIEFDNKVFISLSNYCILLEIVNTQTKELWNNQELNTSMATVVLVDGYLYGTLRIAEATPSSYRELSTANVFNGEKGPRFFATPPVLCNGKIYCRNYKGDLICVDVSK